MMAELEVKTEIKTEISEDDFANAQNEGEMLASPTGFEPVLSA